MFYVSACVRAVPSPTSARGRGSSGGDSAAGGGSRVVSMAWVPATSLLAVLDDGGNLALLDAAGGCRGAALLCGVSWEEGTPARWSANGAAFTAHDTGAGVLVLG